jgi:hypothetical protein
MQPGPGTVRAFLLPVAFGWISAKRLCGIPDVRKEVAFLVAIYFSKSFLNQRLAFVGCTGTMPAYTSPKTIKQETDMTPLPSPQSGKSTSFLALVAPCAPCSRQRLQARA